MLRIIDVPKLNSPSETLSLYFNNITPDQETWDKWTFDNDGAYIDWINEKGTVSRYYSIGFTYSGNERSTDNSIDSITVKVDNINQRWSVVANQYILNNAQVEVWRCFRNTLDFNEDGGQLIFAGHVKSALIGDAAIDLNITPDFSLKKPAPRRMYWPSDFPYLPSSKSITNPIIEG
ncbi:MAG: hypothetical protein RR203_02510 [Synergistaceae bacterium]